LEGLRLWLWDRRIGVGSQVFNVEGVGMMQVGVQHGAQRGPFHNDAHARMSVAMNATFVALGATKEPFQIQIVTREVGHLFADEKAGGKGVHGLGHRLPQGMVRPL